jgi:hypothetical protein
LRCGVERSRWSFSAKVQQVASPLLYVPAAVCACNSQHHNNNNQKNLIMQFSLCKETPIHVYLSNSQYQWHFIQRKWRMLLLPLTVDLAEHPLFSTFDSQPAPASFSAVSVPSATDQPQLRWAEEDHGNCAAPE